MGYTAGVSSRARRVISYVGSRSIFHRSPQQNRLPWRGLLCGQRAWHAPPQILTPHAVGDCRIEARSTLGSRLCKDVDPKSLRRLMEYGVPQILVHCLWRISGPPRTRLDRRWPPLEDVLESPRDFLIRYARCWGYARGSREWRRQ